MQKGCFTEESTEYKHKTMKLSLIGLVVVLAIVGLVMSTAQIFATHTNFSITPTGGNRGQGVLVTIKSVGAETFDCGTLGGCPFVALEASVEPAIPGTGVTLVAPPTIRATFNIPVAATLGTRNVRVTDNTNVVILGAFTVDVAGAVVGGVGATPRERIPRNITSANQFIGLLDDIVDWIFVIVLIFAAIFIVLAGFQFITGGGDPQAVSQARNKLLYAAVGFVVAVLARGIIAARRNLTGS